MLKPLHAAKEWAGHACVGARQAKRAFKAKVKLYHPDVYRGEEDSTALTSRLLLAYELVKDEVRVGAIRPSRSRCGPAVLFCAPS